MDDSKPFIIGTIVVTVLLFGGLLWFNTQNQTATQVVGQVSDEQWQRLTSTGQSRGPADAEITIVEFGDLQCPACLQAEPGIEAYLESHPEVRFVWHHFPLSQHQNAPAAALAAEAAGLQGKFFDMTHKLYQQQGSWSNLADPRDTFASYAQELGLDAERFKADAAAEERRAPIEADLQLGQELGVSSTPTIYVNKQILGSFPRSVADWEKTIEAIMQPAASPSAN